MSKQFKWFSATVFILSMFMGCYAADDPSAPPPQQVDTEHIKALVKALSSEKYGERTLARRELMQIGRPAIEALEYASKSDDCETRVTANELLIALRGRGFMGINLIQEQADADSDGGDGTSGEKPIAPPVVRVVGVANALAMGVNKPFPAEVAGMAAADKVLEVNGKPIHGVKDLMREVIYIGPHRVGMVLIERDGKKLRLPLLLTRNPLTGDSPPVDLEQDPPEHASEKKLAPAATTAESSKDVKSDANAPVKK